MQQEQQEQQEQQGLFLSVEGGEGVGKSTFCRALSQLLTELGYAVLETREPGGTGVAQKIREIFLHPPQNEKLCSLTELFLVSAARAQHVETVIAPHLAHHRNVVLCDRFADSTRVYQGLLKGLSPCTIEPIIAASVGVFTPHLTFLLDCDVKTAQDRVKKREQNDELNRFDSGDIAFYESLRKAYLQIYEQFKPRVVLLNAQNSPSQILAQARMYLEPVLAFRQTK